MKILQANKYHYLNGGADRVFFNTMSLLEENGHEVAPFCTVNPANLPSPYDKYFVDAPEIRELGTLGKIKSIPRFFWNRESQEMLEKLIADFKPDVAHIHNIFNGLSLSILPVLRRHRIPVVMTVHESRLVCPASPWLMRGKLCTACRKKMYANCLLHKCCKGSAVLSAMGMMEMIHKDYLFDVYKYIDRYIFLNRQFRDRMAADHPIMADRAALLPNFAPKLTLKKCGNTGYFLFYGRLSAEKGVKSFVKMAEKVPEAKFVVAGEGEMEPYIRERNLPNVEMRGFLSGDALEAAISNAAFVMIPSECMDNNPMTIIEAYSYGKPVIATTLGGIPDMVNQDETGWLIPPFNPEAFADAVRKAMTIDAGQYDKMSDKALDFAKRSFNRDIYYNKLIDIYQDAINSLKPKIY